MLTSLTVPNSSIILTAPRALAVQDFFKMAAAEAVQARLPLLPQPLTQELVAEFVQDVQDRHRFHQTPGQFFIYRKGGEEEFLGAVNLAPDRTRQGALEIGYIVRPDCWGQGIATKAVGILTDYAFNKNLTRAVTAVVATDNPASAAVLKNNKFELLMADAPRPLHWSRGAERVSHYWKPKPV
jgi:[ribosomal protein S5]-alanine N-acetyltransferase